MAHAENAAKNFKRLISPNAVLIADIFIGSSDKNLEIKLKALRNRRLITDTSDLKHTHDL